MKKLRVGLCLWFLSLTAGSPVGAADISQADKIRATVEQAFHANDFVAIDVLATQYRNDRSRTPSGLWNLTALYSGLGQAMSHKPAQDAKPGAQESDAHWAAMESKTNRWIAQTSGSPVAPIAHSMALIQHGWSYRGEGMASTVTPKGWEQFGRYMALARDTLEKNRRVSSVDPHWYSQMLTIARTQGWDAKSFRVLFEEASGKEPLFYPTYFGAANYLSPLWGGSYQQIEEFADSAVLRTESTEGKGMYARIFWAVYQGGATRLFTHKTIWPKMKAGFEDLLRQYPDTWNKHGYARYACAAGDIGTARRLFKEIGDDPWKELGDAYRLDAWGPTYFEACRAWIASYPR